MKTSPDVLLLPSKLATMAKDIYGTMVVNPGFLSKGSSGGTFAEILVHPTKEIESQGEDGIEIAHKIAERTTINVIKI